MGAKQTKEPTYFKSCLADIRQNKPGVGTLSLSGQNLTDKDVLALLEAIATAPNTVFTSVDLRNNNIGDKGAHALAENNTITDLHLGGNQISDKGAQALAENNSIISLNLYGNRIGDKGAEAFALNTKLTFLNLGNNRINAAGAQALAGSSSITQLYLDGNSIGDQGAEALVRNTKLTALSVTGCGIGGAGVQGLAQNTNILTLGIQSNSIGDLGAQALALNTRITDLNLFDCGIGDAGAAALAGNKILKRLNLDSRNVSEEESVKGTNKISDRGLSAFVHNTTLVELYFRHHHRITGAGVSALASSGLIKLDLSFSKSLTGSTGAIALSKSRTLASLNLLFCGATDADAEALAKNRTLTSLNLKYGSITDPAAQDFCQNTTLTSLECPIVGFMAGRRGGITKELDAKIQKRIRQNQEQLTIFLEACRGGDLNSVKGLLESQQVSPYGCEVDSLHTGLHLAVINQKNNIAMYLVKKHPSLVRIWDKNEKTALDLARESGKPMMVDILTGKLAELEIPSIKKVVSEAKPAPSVVSAESSSMLPIPSSVIIDGESIRFERKNLLGQGGFGQVFKGTYGLVTVAIKMLLLDKFNERMLVEFQQEASLMASLRHPNIIQFYGVTIKQPYQIVMEYMEQGSLYHVLHSSRELSWDQRTQWAVEVGNGLDYLHRFNPQILHRDLKSLNVLISKHGQAKLTDFGLAMASLRSTTKTLTLKSEQPEGVVGSLRWMAPELFALKPKYSAASDMYAYAMVLWELVAREIPYNQVSADSIIQGAVMRGDREEIPEDCVEVLATLIQACWAQEPATRPSASDAVEQLSRPRDKLLGTTGIATQIAKSRGYALESEAPAVAAQESDGYRMDSGRRP